MLNMILKRKLEEPFHKLPPDGQLPPFPTHLKILLKPPFGQEENEFWHQVIVRVHEEASAHKDISTDTAVHGSRIANNSSIHGIARSPYHHGLNEQSAGTAIKSAMHHATMGHGNNYVDDDEVVPKFLGRGGVGAGVAGVMDVETPMRGTPGKRANHVVFSETKGKGVDIGQDMGAPTPSKYGGLNHSSFVGGEPPERRRQSGMAMDETKQDHHHHHHHHEDKSVASFWRQEPSMDIGGPVQHQPVGSAEYSRVLNQVRSSNPALPDGNPALKTLVREQQVRIAILEEQLRTMSVQYEQYVDKIEKEHAEEVRRLQRGAAGADTSPRNRGVSPTSRSVPKGPGAFKGPPAASKQLFPSNNHSMQIGGADNSFRSSIDFAREYPSVDFDNGVGAGVATATIGDPDASMVGAGYPKLSMSPDRPPHHHHKGHHHIHISSPPGKLTSKLPQSPIASANNSFADKFDVRNRPPPPPFPMSMVLKEQETKAAGGSSSPNLATSMADGGWVPPPPFPMSMVLKEQETKMASESSPPNLAASVQTQRWVNLSREGL
jgi:hypothetical protein